MTSINKPIQLGLCCINIQLKAKKPPIYPSRTIQLKSYAIKGEEFLKSLCVQNLQDVLKMVEWNEKNGIKTFRLYSEIFPHKANPKIKPYDFSDKAKSLLKQIGDKAKKYNQRLTFHPGQYNVVGTPNESSFQNTILDLKYHAEMLELMGCDKDSVIVIHGGGIYGDKEKAIERWISNFPRLPEIVQKRLVIENCEKSFSVVDCLKISKQTGVPVVFDTHHFECYKLLHKDEEFEDPANYMSNVVDTWKKAGIKPKFHVSEQGDGLIGHHSDYIETIPDYLLEIPEKYGVEIDIMIEAKFKELAVFKLYEKYPQLNCAVSGKIPENLYVPKPTIPRSKVSKKSKIEKPVDEKGDKTKKEKNKRASKKDISGGTDDQKLKEKTTKGLKVIKGSSTTVASNGKSKSSKTNKNTSTKRRKAAKDEVSSTTSSDFSSDEVVSSKTTVSMKRKQKKQPQETALATKRSTTRKRAKVSYTEDGSSESS